MKITVKNAKVITKNSRSSANNYDWVDYSFDGDYEYASASGDAYEFATGPEPETTSKKDEKSAVSKTKEKRVKKTFKERVEGFKNKVGSAVKWIGDFKTRKAARKLKREKGKDGKDINKDLVPSVVPAKINGGSEDGYKRVNPDGTVTEFKTNEVEKGANGKFYAIEDLKKEGKNTIENGELVKIVPPELVKELKTETGETISFHKDDIIDKDAQDDSTKGMNPTTKKILIGSAIAVGVSLIIFTVYKLSKNGK